MKKKSTASCLFSGFKKNSAVLFLILMTAQMHAQPVCNGQFYHYTSPTNADSIHYYNSSPAGTHYSWTFGDGSTSDSNQPWHLYADTGTYHVCLTVIDTTSTGTCSNTWCDNVHVTAPPPPVCNAQFSHYASTHNPDSVHYSTSNTATSYHYQWTFGDGTSSTSNQPWHLYAGPGAYYVCLTVTNTTSGGTCSATWCDSVHVTPPPPPVCNAQFTTYPSTHNPDSIHFANTSAAGTVYLWHFGDGSTSTSVEPWHLYSGPGAYYVCLTVTNTVSGVACTATWCDSVHVVGPPPPVCNAHFYHYSLTSNPDSVRFYYSNSTSTSYQFLWTFGDGTSSTSNQPVHLYAGAGVYFACLTISATTIGGTCTATWCDSVHVTAPPPPVCNAQFSHYASTHNPDSIHFYSSNTASTSIHYLWNFGDGGTSTSNEPWHLYAGPGSYYVCLTVTNTISGATCTATWCDSVHIISPPPPVCNAHFSHYASTHNPDSIHFYSVNATATSTQYLWSFGDGSSSSSIEPWHLYAGPGTYNVCLTVIITTSGGTCTATWCDSVHVMLPPPPVCNAHFYHYTSTHNSDSVHFYNYSPAGTGYLWSFGDGSSSTSNMPWHLYAGTGTYFVCLTVTNTTSTGTCTATWCDSVRVVSPPPPVCNAHFYHYASTHNPDSIHFYSINAAANTYQYLWNFGDGTVSTSYNPWHLYADTGTYNVCLTVTNTTVGGTCTSTWCDNIHVTLPPPPVCNAHFSHYASTHNPDSLHFYTAGAIASPYHYLWSFGDGTTSTSSEPWHLYTGPGTYYVCLTVTSTTVGGTCTASWCDSVRVIQPPPPVCNAHFNHYPSTHNPDSIHFYSANTSATSFQYFWSFGDGSTSSSVEPWHLYTGPGAYYVCLTVTSTNVGGTCTATWCDSIHVTVPQPPVCNAQFYHYPSTHNADSVHFYNSSPTGTIYLWDFGDNTTSTSSNPWHLFAGPGTYHVCLTVTTNANNTACTNTWCDNLVVPLLSAAVNPTIINEFARVSLANPDSPVDFRIYDITGALRLEFNNLSGTSFDINTADLKPGIYYYEINDGARLLSRGRLIVVH